VQVVIVVVMLDDLRAMRREDVAMNAAARVGVDSSAVPVLEARAAHAARVERSTRRSFLVLRSHRMP
jgi:hypothetical protein